MNALLDRKETEKMLNVGNGSFVKIEEVEVVMPPESAPLKRMVSDAKDNGTCIDLTYGKRVKSIIVLKSGKIVVSSVLSTTLANNMMKKMEKE